MKHANHKILTVLLFGVLQACGTSSRSPEPPYPGIKIGAPYEVMGQHYTPAYESEYDEIGIASWYGPGFNGARTACGERFDQNALTAAHRTLPLPSMVRVTNLGNGKSIIVRVNDRGPFAHDRIIDLSRAAARKLGIKGTAKVRVQFLESATREYVENKRRAVADTSLAKYEPEPPPKAPEPASIPQSNDIFTVADNVPEVEPATVPATPMPVTPAMAAKPSGHFFIQAGLFRVEDNARRLLHELSEYGVSQMKSVSTQEKKLYRVIMGPYQNRNEAKTLLSKLIAIGIPDAKIFQE